MIDAERQPLYRARGLGRRFRRGANQIEALADLSFDVARGDFIAISGPSGSGKTTLLHLLGLLDPGFDGELSFEEQDLRLLSAAARARGRLSSIGFIFQGFHLLPALDVRQNVALPRWRLDGRRREALEQADALLEKLGVGEQRRQRPNHLSAGEMQRVAIARALVNQPSVLLADEPTGNLDQQNMRAVIDCFGELHDEGHTLIVISHDPEVVAAAGRVLALRHGRLRAPSTPTSEG